MLLVHLSIFGYTCEYCSLSPFLHIPEKYKVHRITGVINIASAALMHDFDLSAYKRCDVTAIEILVVCLDLIKYF
jgi:hypothetical protein